MKQLIILISLTFIFSGFITDKEAAYNIAKLGDERYKNEEYKKAIVNYQKALELNSSMKIKKNLGLAFLKNNQLEKAIEIFEGINEDEILFLLGNIYVKNGNKAQKPDERIKIFKKALIKYKEAIKLNSQDMNYKFNYELIQKRVRELENLKNKNKNKENKNKENENKKENDRKNNEKQNNKEENNNEKNNEKNQKKDSTKENKKEQNKDNESKKNQNSQDKKGSDSQEKNKSSENSGKEKMNKKNIDEEKLKKAKQILEALKRQEKDDLKNNQRILRVPGNQENKKNW